MRSKNKYDNLIKGLIVITFIMYCLLGLKFILKNGGSFIRPGDENSIYAFSVAFISILLEALPFVMIGAFVSAIINLFVSEEQISKIIPSNKFIALLCAGFMGIVFPVCECAIVPITRRLVKKGMPIYVAVTFMLAVPIVNPVVLLSTYYAFSGNIDMVLLRGIFGFISAIVIGLVISFLCKDNNQLAEENKIKKCSCGCCEEDTYEYDDHSHCSCGCGCSHEKHRRNIFAIILDILNHTSIELREVGGFLIIGSFISALMQTYISRQAILSIGQGNISSILAMMTLAFVLSLCSEADAFIAKTFVGQFTTGSIVAFLILGPMIDIKNAIMLSSSFKMKFVSKLIGTIFIVCFLMAMLVNVIV